MQRLEEVARIMFGAFEHQVFKKVGKAPLPAFFVLGTYVVPKVDRDHGQVRFPVNDHIESVRQRSFGKSNGWKLKAGMFRS